MNWLVVHIVSGHAFFTGVALVILAALTSTQPRPIFMRIATLAFLVGIIAIVISSTAIPYWYYALAAVGTLVWIASRFRKPWRRWSAIAVAVVWLGAAMMELPYHLTPTLAPAPSRSLTIIGDSVTAGIGGDETSETWPRILARTQALQVQDLPT